MAYPNSVVAWTPVVDFSTTVLAEHVNTLREEAIAVQSTLGTLVSTGSGWIGVFDQVTTSWNTLKDRLANIEYGLKDVWDSIPAGGNTNQVLTKSSNSDYATVWATINVLPSQSGNSGKYLTTNGSSASWTLVDPNDNIISPFLLAGC